METDLLCAEAENVGVQLDRAGAERLLVLCDLVRASPHNLTAILEPEAMRRKHLVDSLSCLPTAAIVSGERIVDLGSGAGFPGIPIAVLCPETEVTLVDAAAKKADFLRTAAERLDLRNVRVVQARAEDLGRDPQWRGQVDCVTARGVAPLRVLAEFALPLCREGGRLVALKGRGADAEIREAADAMRAVGGRVTQRRSLVLPGGDEQREIVRVDKVGHTPAKYPRRAGIPERRPL